VLPCAERAVQMLLQAALSNLCAGAASQPGFRCCCQSKPSVAYQAHAMLADNELFLQGCRL
jgi:hypothetical protein